ncbi:MAG TPA: class I SAM-dependent methyltransferase [Burkholderiales bacterium]|nr:class I SAM-dependent methyltransferase [Burkholderiales bacterium]
MTRAAQLFAALALAAFSALAGAAATPDIPTPYVPSTDLNVDEMLRLAQVRPGDLVYDLGSGDGRIVIAAARDWGARGVGVELDSKLVAQSRERAQQEGVADRVSFQQGDVLKAPIGDATVVTMYLLTPLVERLKPRLLAELKPGTRIVAHEYGFSDWKADRHVQVSKNFYLYVVPASVAGKWKLALTLPAGVREYDLELTQRYQDVKGGARVAGGYLPAFEPRITGERVAFVLVDDNATYRFEGRVSTHLMEGVVRWGPGPRQQEGTWRAVRATAVTEG